jgi:hypothetical protein
VFVPFAGLALAAHAAAGFALLGRHFVLAGVCFLLAQVASVLVVLVRSLRDEEQRLPLRGDCPSGTVTLGRRCPPVLGDGEWQSCTGPARTRRAAPPRPRRRPAPRRVNACTPRPVR